MERYFIQTRSGRKGPFTIEQLQAFVDAGRIPYSFNVIDELTDMTVSLSHLVEPPRQDAQDTPSRETNEHLHTGSSRRQVSSHRTSRTHTAKTHTRSSRYRAKRHSTRPGRSSHPGSRYKAVYKTRRRNAGPIIGFVIAAVVGLLGVGYWYFYLWHGSPGEPTEFHLALQNTLLNQKPQILWRALPDSYRHSIEEVVHGVADTVDPAFYKKNVSLILNLADIAEQKVEFLAGFSASSMGRSASKQKELQIILPKLGRTLRSLFEGPLENIHGLRTLDVERYLVEQGSEVMSYIFELVRFTDDSNEFLTMLNRVRGTTFEIHSINGSVAKIRRIEPDGTSKDSLETVRLVEGKWIPEELATEIPNAIKKCKEAIAKLKTQKPAADSKARFVINSINSSLQKLLTTNTQEEFNAAMLGMLMDIQKLRLLVQ